MAWTMAGKITECVLLSYRTPAESVEHLLPRGLELVTRGPWAFWNVVLCKVEHVRPEGVPAFCGLRYHHVAYRLLVQAMDDRAELMRGLYFVRSDVDSVAVDVLGGRMTDLRPHRATIALEASDEAVRIETSGTLRGEGDARVRVEAGEVALPGDSAFPTLRDAREFLAYPPLGLAVDGDELALTRVLRNDAQWRETPMRVTEARLDYLDGLGQTDRVLELATRVAPIEYRWRLGERRRLLRGGRLQHEGVPRNPRRAGSAAGVAASKVA